jgi:hypothetical protein
MKTSRRGQAALWPWRAELGAFLRQGALDTTVRDQPENGDADVQCASDPAAHVGERNGDKAGDRRDLAFDIGPDGALQR